MVDVKWIKIFIDIFNNRKIRMIESMSNGDAIIVIWFKLLCLAGEINEGGLVTFDKQTPYTNQMLAIQFGKKVDVITEALNLFVKFKMIDIEDGFIWILNWEKYQSLDKIEHQKKNKRDYMRKYMAAKRANQKTLDNVSSNVSLMLDNVSSLELEKEEDIDSSINTTTTKKEKSSSKPTLDEVVNYANVNKFEVDPVNFYNHCESINWQINGTPIRCWKYGLKLWNDNYLKAKSKNIDIKLEDWQIQGMNDVMEEFKDEG